MIEAGEDERSEDGQRRSEGETSALSGGEGGATSLRREAAEREADRKQRARRSKRIEEHRQHRRRDRGAAGGERESRAKRRPGAGRPGQRQNGAGRRLADEVVLSSSGCDRSSPTRSP